MSSSSSIATPFSFAVGDPRLLHLIERVRERRLDRERLLDFFARHVGVLAVFEEARALVLAEESDDRRRIRRVVRRPTLQGFKGRLDARLSEEERGVFAI